MSRATELPASSFVIWPINLLFTSVSFLAVMTSSIDESNKEKVGLKGFGVQSTMGFVALWGC